MVQAVARLNATHLDQLRRSFTGDIFTPRDATYDEARRLWNAVHDLRPAAIVRPTTVAEVATAIRFGRDHDLELAVRSGGHSAAGRAGLTAPPRRRSRPESQRRCHAGSAGRTCERALRCRMVHWLEGATNI